MARRTLGATGRFGPRMGKSTRDKIGRAEEAVKNSTKCPFCLKDKVKRQSTGIWLCTKCGSKFTGKAYTFDKKSLVVAKAKVESKELSLDETMPEAQLEEAEASN